MQKYAEAEQQIEKLLEAHAFTADSFLKTRDQRR